MENKKIIIWDLFGGSMKSVARGLVHLSKFDIDFHIYTFDINFHKDELPNNTCIHLDLCSFDNLKTYVEQNNIPHPDIITCSPKCDAFSHMKHYGRKIDIFGKKVSERLGLRFDESSLSFVVRDIQEIVKGCKSVGFFKLYNPISIYENTILGTQLVHTVVETIKHYQPKCWYIENPEKSLMWDYISLNCGFNIPFHNKTYFSGWNPKYTLKPTIFASNVKLRLDCPRVIKNITRKKGDRLPFSSSKHSMRVSIPPELILTIFGNFAIFLRTIHNYDI